MNKLDFYQEKDTLKIVPQGNFNAESTVLFWNEATKKLNSIRPKKVIIDAKALEYCDGAGIALLIELKRRQQNLHGSFEIQGLKPQISELMSLFEPEQTAEPDRRYPFIQRFPVQFGRAFTDLLKEIQTQISFAGEFGLKLIHTLLRLGSLRWKDVFLIAEKNGANAVSITALLGFLIGIILAFQSVISMEKFGAEIYVADLVVIVLFRELGPLLTAFILAARTGSAFAAEIGTMKVNEEIDALTTMGLEPVRFLVIPRVLATVFITPLLTMFNNFFGLIGCGLVMTSIGFAPIVFINQIQGATDLSDLFGGLVKTFVFGLLIAVIGCQKGLQTKTGASAVGDSATRAVVAGIIAIVVADGVFAVMYYFLGI